MNSLEPAGNISTEEVVSKPVILSTSTVGESAKMEDKFDDIVSHTLDLILSSNLSDESVAIELTKETNLCQISFPQGNFTIQNTANKKYLIGTGYQNIVILSTSITGENAKWYAFTDTIYNAGGYDLVLQLAGELRAGTRVNLGVSNLNNTSQSWKFFPSFEFGYIGQITSHTSDFALSSDQLGESLTIEKVNSTEFNQEWEIVPTS
ncbi:unnamed protein product [Cunninghamella blakesleeana]